MIKNTKKMKKKYLVLLSLLLVILSGTSCKSSDDLTNIYDPSLPVTFESFSPEKGGSTSQMIITGTNFGIDTANVQVKVGNRYAKVVGVSPTKIYAVVKAHSVDESGDADVTVSIAEKSPFTFPSKFNYSLTQMVSTVAGTGAEGQADGDAMSATFKDIACLLFNREGTLYLSEENNSVRKITTDGMVTTLFTNTGWRKRAMAFNLTQDTIYMARDAWGTDNPCLYYMKADDDFASPRTFFVGHNETNNSVSVNPVDGYVFWNQYKDGSVWYSNPGTINDTYARADGFHSDSNYEVYSAWSKDGKIFYRIIRNQHVIYKRAYDPVIHKFVGDELVLSGKIYNSGFADGIGEDARLNQPCQCVADDDGNLYVADRNNNCIRKITPDGNTTVYAGNRTAGLVNGLPLKSEFNKPEGLAFAKDGSLYVGDHDNHVIRRIVVE